MYGVLCTRDKVIYLDEYNLATTSVQALKINKFEFLYCVLFCTISYLACSIGRWTSQLLSLESLHFQWDIAFVFQKEPSLLLIQGGTCVNDDEVFEADVLISDNRIK